MIDYGLEYRKRNLHRYVVGILHIEQTRKIRY